MTAYDVDPRAPAGPEHPEIPQGEHPKEPQLVEIPMDMRTAAPAVPFTGLMPEVASSTPPATPGTSLVIPATFEPPFHLSLGSPYPFQSS